MLSLFESLKQNQNASEKTTHRRGGNLRRLARKRDDAARRTSEQIRIIASVKALGSLRCDAQDRHERSGGKDPKSRRRGEWRWSPRRECKFEFRLSERAPNLLRNCIATPNCCLLQGLPTGLARPGNRSERPYPAGSHADRSGCPFQKHGIGLGPI